MEYEEHDGQKFLVVNPHDYALAHREDCLVGSKTAHVTARQGRVGEVVETRTQGGFKETSNVVSYDTVTGEPDWIVTQASGEQMIVTNQKYNSLYEVSSAKPGETIKPVGKFRAMIRLKENVAFKASWGEMQYIKKDGVMVVIDENDIYGIQKEEFDGSYDVIADRDELATQLFDVSISASSKKVKKPTIFLSVAYPYDNVQDQEILKRIIRYVNSKGVKAVNIRNISGENLNLVSEINKGLTDCEGILSLAFNKGGNKTSPFIQIETALAQVLNLETLMVVPSEVEKEGVLFDKNVDGKVSEIKDKENFIKNENDDVFKDLDNFIENVLKRFKFKLSEQSLYRFKQAFVNSETKAQGKKELVAFLKNFYSTKENFSFEEIYIKRPTKIKATVIENDGVYQTKEGATFLSKGDYLVTDFDGTIYNVEKQEFESRYIKVNGEQDSYVSKLIPTVAREKNGKCEVFALSNTEDKYSMDKDVFTAKYQTMEDYILSLVDPENSDSVQEL